MSFNGYITNLCREQAEVCMFAAQNKAKPNTKGLELPAFGLMAVRVTEVLL